MDKEQYNIITRKLRESNKNYFVLYEELKDVEYSDIENNIHNLGYLKGYVDGLKDAGVKVIGGLDGQFRVTP